MTPFKTNWTKSIDNLNRICKTILSVYDNETIDKMLNDNVLNQTGSDLTFNNTVAGGKFDWVIQGSCEQDGTPTPTEPIDVKVVTGDNEFVVCNKNLLNSIFTQTNTKNNVTATPNTDGSISLSGTASANTFFTLSGYHWDNVDFSSLTDKSEIYKFILIDTITGITMSYTYGNSTTSLRITSGTNCDNVKVYPMILKKPVTDESFVKHAEQKVTLHLGTNYLAGIEDYDDEIEGKTDDWKFRRKTRKKILDGSENWNIANNFYYLSNAISGFAYSDENQAILCNLFKWGDIGGNNSNLGFRIVNNNVFRGREATMKSVSDWKTYLSSHNLLLYYALATPTEETITDQTLINDLNNMYNLMGYDGQTNISIIPDTGNATPSLKVTTFVTEKEV